MTRNRLTGSKSSTDQRLRTVQWVWAGLLPLTIWMVAGFAWNRYIRRPADEKYDVIVIGGGISGLAAAYILTSRDWSDANTAVPYSVTLIEAKDRLGGRLHTVRIPNGSSGSPIDLGGMYWHGSESPAMKFLQSLTPTVPSGGKSNLPGHTNAEWRIYSPSEQSRELKSNDPQNDWRIVSASELERAQDLYQQWDQSVKQQHAQHAKTNAHIGATDQSCRLAMVEAPGNHDAEHEVCPLTPVTQTDDDSKALLSRWSDAFLNQLSPDDRHLVDFIKTMSFQLDRSVALEELALNGVQDDWGWRDISGTDHIAQFGMSEVIQRLADRIDMTLKLGERVTRIDFSQEQTCRVETNQNRSYTSRACIVTLPIGVLKVSHRALFHPPLPIDKQDAIERAGVGAYNTLAVHWTVPICESKSTAHYLVGHPDSDNPLRFGFVCSAQLRDADAKNSITQFYVSGVDFPFDDLAYWKNKALQVVQGVFREARLSHIVDAKISAWHLDEDVRGSYSVATRLTRGNADRLVLAKSIGSEVVFAGEHTHSGGRYQSIDGAFETGQRAAIEIMNRIAARGLE